MKKVLLLEDDPNLGFILKEQLEMNGYDVRLNVNGVDGIAAYHQDKFDLCLVDVMMPKKDGFTFAKEVREKDQTTPIIFLTAKSLKHDRIEGFKIGCDDYITKPFSMEELLLRVQAVLRRTTKPAESEQPRREFTLGKFSFNSETQTLKCGKDEQKLTGKESELLRLLCMNLNRTLERDVALKAIWGDDSYFNSRSMDVFISKLRKYLQRDPRVEIMSVHGRGFKLVVGS
ncbi:MAG: response regulator transcription factor [Ignavibacteriae bacterium]|nr:response regulator transcription factor [Ignavibacteriota bacterium]